MAFIDRPLSRRCWAQACLSACAPRFGASMPKRRKRRWTRHDSPVALSGADRGLEREEDRALGPLRPAFPQVAQQRLSDGPGERVQVRPPRLRTAHPERLRIPVDIVQPQTTDLAGTQAVDGQQQERGAVASVRGPRALGRGQQPLDVVPSQSGRDGLPRVQAGRCNRLGQTRRAPALRFGKAEERPPGISGTRAGRSGRNGLARSWLLRPDPHRRS